MVWFRVWCRRRWEPFFSRGWVVVKVHSWPLLSRICRVSISARLRSVTCIIVPLTVSAGWWQAVGVRVRAHRIAYSRHRDGCAVIYRIILWGGVCFWGLIEGLL